MNKDPFSFYKFGLTDNAAIRGTVNSLYSLFLTIGVVGILLTILLVGVKLMSQSPQKRAEALEEMKWKVLIAIILFGMSGVIGAILRVVSSFT